MGRSTTLVLALAATLMGISAGVRWAQLDPLARMRRDAMRLDEDVLRSPGPEVLKIAAMEHAPAWADLLWLQIVQELGKPAEGEQASYDRLQRWANIAVDLDESYFTVYYASSIHLIAWAKRARAAELLLLKGRKFLPERWEFPFLMGYIYFFLRGDAPAAATWWELAIPLPEAPRYLPSLAARSRAVSGDESGAIELLEMMMDTLEGPQKEDAIIRLKLLKSEPILRRYDIACEKFLAGRGRLPADAAELHREGYAADPPFDLLDKPITLDADCRARTEYISVRTDEMKSVLGKEGVSPEDEKE